MERTALAHHGGYVRHPSLYFDEGDIVLTAEIRGDLRQVFKVHRSFLCHYSEPFRGMFSVVAQDQSEERYDSVPLVDMPAEDAAADVAALLEVMYKASCVLDHEFLLCILELNRLLALFIANSVIPDDPTLHWL